MAKIDTKLITGYEQMTLEQKVAALEAYNHPDPDYSGYVKKDLYDKAASDAASWKKKHNELLTEDERKKQEDADALANMKKELDELRKDKTISEFKAKGYDEKLAADTAKAMADGNTDKVFANQQIFLETYAKQVKASAMQGTPKPASGSGSNGADFSKKAADAQSTGNFAEAAYYTRLMNQDNNTQ